MSRLVFIPVGGTFSMDGKTIVCKEMPETDWRCGNCVFNNRSNQCRSRYACTSFLRKDSKQVKFVEGRR